jgi:hypothetical protein
MPCSLDIDLQNMLISFVDPHCVHRNNSIKDSNNGALLERKGGKR